jgi:hypothetical protein
VICSDVSALESGGESGINIQRLVSEPDSDRPYAGPLHLTSG